MAVGAVVARILTQYSDKGSKQAQKDIYKLGKNIDAYAKKATKAFGLVAAASVALSVKIGSDAVKAAIEDSKSQLTLSNALKTTTGATTQAIAVVEDYISKQQMLTNVQDTELRASLQSLVVATGDVTEAQRLQGIALDVAAATGKDLNSVTVAMVRAQQGNTTALKRLSPELSSLITKTTKAEDIFSLLGATYEGTAEKLAKQDPIKSLQIAFGEVSESIGFALLPVVKEFAQYLITYVIPQIQAWVDINKDQLAQSLKNAAGFAKDLLEQAIKIAKWSTENIGFIKAMGVAIGAMFVVGKVTAFISAINGLIAVYRTLAASAGVAAVAGAFATGGLNLAAGAVAIGGYAFLVEYLHDGNVEAKKLEETNANLGKGVADVTKQVYGGAAALKYQEEVAAASAKQRQIDAAKAAKAAKAAELATKKDAALKAAIARGQALLSKFGVKTAETDPIQLEAARLNLIKQGNIAEMARWEAVKKGYEAQFEANKALARYNDLLTVLNDKVITSDEIVILAKKWGMTKEAVMSYIQTIIAVSDGQISDDEVTNLAKGWGSTKEQAARYLDFFNALNDGYLSNAEIEKLKNTWNLSSKEVQIYADLITKASDYVLSDAEITALGTNWGLTTKEVIEYIRKLGQPVTFSGTLIDPATQAELGWKNALAALLAYQAALGGKGYSSSSSSSTYTYDPAASPAANAEAQDAANAAADAAASAAAAVSDATQAAIDAADAVDEIVAQIASTIAGSVSPSNLSPKGQKILADERARLEAVDKQSQQAEAYAAGMAKRYGGFVGSSTMDNAKSLTASSSNSGVVVNLTVNGSVSTEQDLVNTVRNGLLATQTNGNSLTLQAI